MKILLQDSFYRLPFHRLAFAGFACYVCFAIGFGIVMLVSVWVLIGIVAGVAAGGAALVVKSVVNEHKEQREIAVAMAAAAAEAAALKAKGEAEKRRALLDAWYDSEKLKGKIAGTPQWFDRQIALAVETAKTTDLGFAFRCQQLKLDADELFAWADEMLHGAERRAEAETRYKRVANKHAKAELAHLERAIRAYMSLYKEEENNWR